MLVCCRESVASHLKWITCGLLADEKIKENETIELLLQKAEYIISLEVWNIGAPTPGKSMEQFGPPGYFPTWVQVLWDPESGSHSRSEWQGISGQLRIHMGVLGEKITATTDTFSHELQVVEEQLTAQIKENESDITGQLNALTTDMQATKDDLSKVQKSIDTMLELLQDEPTLQVRRRNRRVNTFADAVRQVK